MRITAFLISLLISSYLFPQSNSVILEPVSKHSFSDGTKTGKLHHFGDFFKQDQSRYKDYLKFNHNRKTQRFLNYLAGGAIAISLVDGLRDNNGFVLRRKLRGGLRWGGAFAFFGNVMAGSLKGRYKKALLNNNLNFQKTNRTLTNQKLNLIGFNQTSKHKFTHNGKTGKLQNFDYLFIDDKEINDLFITFNKARKKQVSGNTLAAVLGIGGITAGLLLSTNMNDGLSKGLTQIFFGGSGILLGGLVALISNLTSGSKKAEYRNLLLSKVNPQLTNQNLEQSKLDFGITSNGIGFVYSF